MNRKYSTKQVVNKMEIINYIKNILLHNSSFIFFNKEKGNFSVGYNIDCECFDKLNYIYTTGSQVFASFNHEPENPIELQYIHESYLSTIVEYIEHDINENRLQQTAKSRKLTYEEANDICKKAEECFQKKTNAFYKGVAFIYEEKTYQASKPNVMIAFPEVVEYGIHIGKIWALWGKFENILSC